MVVVVVVNVVVVFNVVVVVVVVNVVVVGVTDVLLHQLFCFSHKAERKS